MELMILVERPNVSLKNNLSKLEKYFEVSNYDYSIEDDGNNIYFFILNIVNYNEVELLNNKLHELNFEVLEIIVDNVKNKVKSLNSEDENNITNGDLNSDIFFNSKIVMKQLSKLVKTADFNMRRYLVSPKKISDHIVTLTSEIYMEYNDKNNVTYKVRDIVECNFGVHLSGELSGGRVPCVIIKINNKKRPYIVPITKKTSYINGKGYLKFKNKQDLEYEHNESLYKEGTLLLELGQYINPKRVNKVLGYVYEDFFIKIKKELARVYEFEENNKKYINNNIDTADVKLKAEEYVYNKFKAEIDNINKDQSMENIVVDFLNCIGFKTNETLIVDLFVYAISNDIYKKKDLIENYSKKINIKGYLISNNISKEVNKWLLNNLDIKEKYYKFSIISLIKLFKNNIVS